jgi:hypothetical protein
VGDGGHVRLPGGRYLSLADIIEFRDGKILKETRYYAEPFAEIRDLLP